MADSDSADYSFADEYRGPPLAYDLPRAIPIDLDSVPIAYVAAAGSAAAGSVPVAQPLSHFEKQPPPSTDAPAAEAAAGSSESPTSVIENHHAAIERSAELAKGGGSGRICSLSVAAAGAATTAPGSPLSSEFEFESLASESEDEAIAAALPMKKSHGVTFRDPSQSSLSASPVSSYGNKHGSVPGGRGKKRACHRCGKGGLFMERETCLACGARYCAGCLVRAMGSMPEGRKCIGCTGQPILECYHGRLGHCSRMLRHMLSDREVEQVMCAERVCEANQLQPEDVEVNGERLTEEDLVVLLSCRNAPRNLRPGSYWYDNVSGYWGKVGHKPHRIISPDLNIGGTLGSTVSNGNTGVSVNGREITKAELKMLKLAGIQCAGRLNFWVSADGSCTEEGQKTVLGKLWDKPIVKVLSPVLQLPIPTKASGLGGYEAVDLINTAIPDHLGQKLVQKLLLVGSQGSGASTIFKQAKFLYKSPPFSAHEREDIKLVIQTNLYNFLGTLLEGCEKFEEERLAEKKTSNEDHPTGAGHGESNSCEYSVGPRLRGFSDWLLTAMASGDMESIFPAATREYSPLLEDLWKDPAIQAAYERRSELPWLPYNASYFLDRVADISQLDFEPSDTDILYANGITSSNGLASTDFVFPQRPFDRLVSDDHDALLRYQLIWIADNHLGSDCKWLEMFDDVRLVIFCVSLSDYSERSPDSSGVILNNIIKGRTLFEKLATHPTMIHMDFLLVLTDFHLLEKKINGVPLTVCGWFHDFAPVISNHETSSSRGGGRGIGATLAQTASHYIAVKFKRLFSSLTGRRLYVTFADAWSRESVDMALQYAREVVRWEDERPASGSSDTYDSTEPSSYSH